MVVLLQLSLGVEGLGSISIRHKLVILTFNNSELIYISKIQILLDIYSIIVSTCYVDGKKRIYFKQKLLELRALVGLYSVTAKKISIF